MEIAWGAVNFFQRGFLLLWSAIWIPLAIVARWLTGSVRLPLAMARRVWAPPLLLFSGARLEVQGLERLDPRQAYLFAANHQSIIDVPALFVALPRNLRFVARSSLRRVPLLGTYMNAMGMVFVGPGGKGGGIAEEMKRAAALLASGQSLVTFPEGTRSVDGRMTSFKGGSLAAAIEAGAPIVPVAIDGAYAVLPRGGFRLRPGRIRVRVGAPVGTRDLKRTDRAALARRIEARVGELLASGAARQPHGSEATSGRDGGIGRSGGFAG